jgi:hypothetical protein
MDEETAAADITPTQSSEPERRTTYNGRKTESKPNAIS